MWNLNTWLHSYHTFNRLKRCRVTFGIRLLSLWVSTKLKVDRTDIFTVDFTLCLSLSCLRNIMLNKILLHRGCIVYLVASILDLGRSCLLGPVQLLLLHLFSGKLDACVSIRRCLIILARSCVVNFRAANYEISLTEPRHVQLHTIGVFAAERSRVGCLIAELRINLRTNREVLLAGDLTHALHVLRARVLRWQDILKLFLRSWNRLKFYRDTNSGYKLGAK